MTAPPAAFVVGGGTWPDGPFRSSAPDAVRHVARAAKLISAAAPDFDAVTELAKKADLDPSVVSDIVAGAMWPSVTHLAPLEQALGRRLWAP